MIPLTDAEKEKLYAQIYTPFSVASEELEKRWNDDTLRRKVFEFFGHYMLPTLENKQRYILSRNVITPNYELEYFLDLLGDKRANALFIEYDGKFVAKNAEKYHLCKLLFYNGLGRKNGKKLDSLRIVDFNKWEGHMLKDIKTTWDEPLIDFHHNLLFQHYPDLQDKIINFTLWFNLTRSVTEYYYLYYLSLFICHGVLFENFLLDDPEEVMFVKKKVIPSVQRIEELLGVKPLIVPLLPLSVEKNTLWLSYPHLVKEEIVDMIKSQ